MTLGEILDKAIRLYRQNFLKFLGILAIPYIPLTLIQMVLSVLYTTTTLQSIVDQRGDPSELLGRGIAAIAGIIIFGIANFILVSGFATAALTRAIANNYMNKPIGIVASYRAIAGSGWKLVLALLLAGILVVILFFWALVPIVGWLSGPGVGFFLLLIVIPLIAPIAALENLGVLNTIRRAWDMGRSRFWWLIGYAIVLFLLGHLIVSGPVYLLRTVLQFAFYSLPEIDYSMQTMLSTIITTLVSLALGLLYTPLQLTMMTVVYFDLRARHEGLDLALQLASLNEPQTAAALPEISTRESTPLLTGLDLGRFALLSLISMALLGCYFFFVFVFLGITTAGL